jgi:hypothetical protein
MTSPSQHIELSSEITTQKTTVDARISGPAHVLDAELGPVEEVVPRRDFTVR